MRHVKPEDIQPAVLRKQKDKYADGNYNFFMLSLFSVNRGYTFEQMQELRNSGALYEVTHLVNDPIRGTTAPDIGDLYRAQLNANFSSTISATKNMLYKRGERLPSFRQLTSGNQTYLLWYRGMGLFIDPDKYKQEELLEAGDDSKWITVSKHLPAREEQLPNHEWAWGDDSVIVLRLKRDNPQTKKKVDTYRIWGSIARKLQTVLDTALSEDAIGSWYYKPRKLEDIRGHYTGTMYDKTAKVPDLMFELLPKKRKSWHEIMQQEWKMDGDKFEWIDLHRLLLRNPDSPTLLYFMHNFLLKHKKDRERSQSAGYEAAYAALFKRRGNG